jgi:hypothetical protein
MAEASGADSRIMLTNSTNLAKMAEASGEDSRIMLTLTNATKRDSGIMRLIAVITMVYLPGTFMAVIAPTSLLWGYLLTI